MQFYDVSQTSLAKSGSSVVEEYIPLVFMDGTSNGSTTTSAGVNFIADGLNGIATSITSSTKLHTLNSNWNPSQQFAFEISIYVSSTGTAYAALWDMTSNAIVSSSQISTTSSSATVIRSSKFTLIPSHSYGVTLWNPNAGYSNISDASLIAFT